eukprot:353890-Chlamydomonas_euryale.AAC.4
MPDAVIVQTQCTMGLVMSPYPSSPPLPLVCKNETEAGLFCKRGSEGNWVTEKQLREWVSVMLSSVSPLSPPCGLLRVLCDLFLFERKLETDESEMKRKT